MNLPGYKNKTLIVAITGCFLVMIGAGFPIINNALKGKEKDFNDKLFYVVAAFEEMVLRDSSMMVKVNTDNAMIQILKTELKGKIDSVFVENGIPLDYVLGAGKVQNEKVTWTEIGKLRKSYTENNLIWSSDPKDNPEIVNTKVKIAYLGPPGRKIYYAKIFFPHKRQFLFRSLLPQFAVMGLTVIMLFICFLLLLAIIRKQHLITQSKDDFISNMTHEIKTPLFTISIATKLLAEREGVKANRKYLDYLNTIREETSRLLSLANRVMETSELDKKTIHQEKEEVDVHTILRNAASRLELIRQEHGTKFEMRLDATRPFLYGNEKNLETVFVNVLDNGIKYSGDDSHILVDTKNDGSNLVISISDNGIGIDSSIKDLIFDRFFRAHTGYIHNTKGYGIGLSFAKSVVDAHDGRIKVNSVLDKGSTFIITLPSIKN